MVFYPSIIIKKQSDTIELQSKKILSLTAESTEWESKCYKYQDIIDELEKELKDWENLDLDNLLVLIRNIDNKLKRIKKNK